MLSKDFVVISKSAIFKPHTSKMNKGLKKRKDFTLRFDLASARSSSSRSWDGERQVFFRVGGSSSPDRVSFSSGSPSSSGGERLDVRPDPSDIQVSARTRATKDRVEGIGCFSSFEAFVSDDDNPMFAEWFFDGRPERVVESVSTSLAGWEGKLEIDVEE